MVLSPLYLYLYLDLAILRCGGFDCDEYTRPGANVFF